MSKCGLGQRLAKGVDIVDQSGPLVIHFSELPDQLFDLFAAEPAGLITTEMGQKASFVRNINLRMSTKNAAQQRRSGSWISDHKKRNGWQRIVGHTFFASNSDSLYCQIMAIHNADHR